MLGLLGATLLIVQVSPGDQVREAASRVGTVALLLQFVVIERLVRDYRHAEATPTPARARPPAASRAGSSS